MKLNRNEIYPVFEGGPGCESGSGAATSGKSLFRTLGADAAKKYPESRLLLSSADLGWPALGVEVRSHSIGRSLSLTQHNTEIVIAIDGNKDSNVIRDRAGQRQVIAAASETIWITPEGVSGEELSITAPIPKALHIYLPIQPFNVLARQHGLANSPVASIQYVGGVRDELIWQLGLAVLTELKTEAVTSRMLVETVSLMLAARLTHNYSTGNYLKQSDPRQPRLDKTRLQRVLDYIDRHLDEDITVSGLAGVANLSTFHFTRMFTAAVGTAPFRYVGRKRLERAMLLLATSSLSLDEIADLSRFSSQASFNRAFRRTTGMTPGEYRRLPDARNGIT